MCETARHTHTIKSYTDRVYDLGKTTAGQRSLPNSKLCFRVHSQGTLGGNVNAKWLNSKTHTQPPRHRGSLKATAIRAKDFPPQKNIHWVPLERGRGAWSNGAPPPYIHSSKEAQPIENHRSGKVCFAGSSRPRVLQRICMSFDMLVQNNCDYGVHLPFKYPCEPMRKTNLR